MNTLFLMATTASLTVPHVDLGRTPDIARVDAFFETSALPLHTIGCVGWPDDFPDRPDVKFRIAHSGDEIYIKYYVTENALRAVYDDDNNRPWEESCVEFFVTPSGREDDARYYNMEMSCLGYGILHGGAKGDRSPADVGRIRRMASLDGPSFGVRQGEGPYTWTLTVAIPADVYADVAQPLSGATLRGNFYKCGDKLPRPHYLSWSPIDTPRPSFHEPAFFGYLIFE